MTSRVGLTEFAEAMEEAQLAPGDVELARRIALLCGQAMRRKQQEQGALADASHPNQRARPW